MVHRTRAARNDVPDRHLDLDEPWLAADEGEVDTPFDPADERPLTPDEIEQRIEVDYADDEY